MLDTHINLFLICEISTVEQSSASIFNISPYDRNRIAHSADALIKGIQIAAIIRIAHIISAVYTADTVLRK